MAVLIIHRDPEEPFPYRRRLTETGVMVPLRRPAVKRAAPDEAAA